MKSATTTRISAFILLNICFHTITPLANAQEQPMSDENRAQWFTDARFGMFIHWGLYSAAEGIWKGERHRHFNNYAEWIMYRNDIPLEEYVKLADRFDWDRIDPEQWVLTAKKAGMKYIIITAKHHDGIAVWDSEVSDYALPKLGKSKRDPIAELAEACKKHGVKLGFYYSHWIDWQHPFGWNHNRELTGSTTPEEYNRYWQEKVIPQLRELLTKYGDIALLWFDMWIPHQQTVVERHQIDQVLALVRELQPDCLINSRLGIPVSDSDIDFETLGDNQFGAIYKEYPWETPGTIAHSWGYNALENQWKSTGQLLQSLISNVSLNGGYTLNVGPRADGSIPYESLSRLEDLGHWLDNHGESIYGSGGLDLLPTQHDWGRITCKKQDSGGETVYLHVFNWPLDGILRVSGITAEAKEIYLLEDPSKSSLIAEQEGPYIHISLPANASDHHVSVVAMEFDRDITLDKQIVAESTFGGYALKGGNAAVPTGGVKYINYDGRHPEHLLVSEPIILTWKVYVHEPAVFDLDISYSMQGKGEAKITVLTDHHELTASLSHTGQIVMEPNENNYTDRFVEKPVGRITFDESGYHEIRLKIEPATGETVLFNWLWLDQ